MKRYKELEKSTAICFERIPFTSNEVLNEFQKCNTEGITEFKTDFMKHMLNSIVPKSFHTLIQISGLSHGAGVWLGNGDQLIADGYSPADVIAYRDDVLNDIQKKMIAKGISDTGFAYKVMEDTRRGIYAQNGIPDNIKSNLKAIGMEDWFIDSIGKIRYLFPKAHGIIYTKSAATLMWYKIHYPKEFYEIMV